MKFALIFVVVLLSLVYRPVFANEAFIGTVKKIIDGDSLLIVSGTRTIEVRLYGIDCPEYDQPFAAYAKAQVKKLVYGETVLVHPAYFDSYNRQVAIVIHGGETLNGELVRRGLAWVYPRYCRKKVCDSWKKMERAAINDKRGLWSRSEAISPWSWKRMKRGDS